MDMTQPYSRLLQADSETPPLSGEQLKYKLINSKEIDQIRSVCHL